MIKVSEANDFGAGYVPVHDVNPSLFAGADEDGRDGNIVNERERTFVIGKRTADRASDLRLYSRALQTNTRHYFQISCGEDRAQGAFQTTNIPLGMVFNDPPPVDPDNPGEYGWPNFSPAIRSSLANYVSNEKVIDPHTGVQARRWTLQEDLTSSETLRTYTVAEDQSGTGEWSSPEKALADDGNTDANAAVYTGVHNANLFLGYNAYDSGPTSFLSWSVPRGGVDYYRLVLTAWASGATDADRTVEICLTFDRLTCGSKVKELSLGTSPATYGVSDANGSWMSDWSIPGKPQITRGQMASPSGSVDVAGTLVTRTAAGSNCGWFSKHWKNGSKIRINGVDRTIARLMSAEKLEITEDLGILTGVPYTASNFGLLIRKKTPSPDRISIGSVRAWSRNSMGAYYWSASAVSEDCSRVKAPDGRYYCNVSGTLYSVAVESGDVRMLGSARIPAGTVPGLTWGVPFNGGMWYGDCGATTYVDLIWSTTNAKEWYCLVPVGSASNLHLFRGRYTGDGAGIGSQQLNTDTWATPGVVSYTDLSSTKDISTMIKEFSETHPSPEVFDPALHSCNLAGGKYETYVPVWCLRGGGQDKLGWIAVYDQASNSIVAAMTTHSNPWPARWGAGHGAGMYNFIPWMSGAGQGTGRLDASTATGAGPYLSTVATGIPKCTIGSTCEVCPGNESGNPNLPNWPTGLKKCTSLVVDGEPCDVNPNTTTETNTNHSHCGTPGGHYLQDAKPGDIFVMNNKFGEFLRLLSKSGDGKNRTWIVERKYGKGWKSIGNCGADCKLIATAGAAAVDETNAAENYAGSFYWDFLSDPAGLNANGKTVIVDPNPLIAHGATNNGYRIYVVETGGTSKYRVGQGTGLTQLMDPPFSFITGNPGFGKPAKTFTSATESHVGMNQVAASEHEKQWTVDARPWMGSTAYGSGATRVAGMSNTYKVSQPNALSRKHLPTMAFCGHHPLKDVSGPGSIISDAKPYSYCVSNAAGECVPGSSAPDIYVSCPMVVNTACGTDNQPEKEDICVGDLRPFTGAQVQLGLGYNDPSGAFQRVLTRSFTRFKLQGPYWNLKSLPDASWLYTRNDWLEGSSNNLLLLKNPGWPAKDNVNRGTFIPVEIQLGSLPPGTDNVVAEFGYNPLFQCTSRAEACVANASTVNETAPFFWNGELPSGLPCSGGCKVTVPAIPQRVVYYRLKYRNAANATIGSSRTQIAVTP